MTSTTDAASRTPLTRSAVTAAFVLVAALCFGFGFLLGALLL